MPLANKPKVSLNSRKYVAAESAFARGKVPHAKINMYRVKSLRRITTRTETMLLFMKGYLMAGKKFDAKAQESLKSTLQRLDNQIDSFLLTESAFNKTKSFPEKSKERITKGLLLGRLLSNSVIELEQKGLVEKGFAHNVFRKIKNGEPIQN
jgi:hypothetical protein